MRSFSQLVRRWTFPAMTVLALLVLAGGYYLFYKSSREDYFRHRHLRRLAFESARLGDTVEAYRRLLKNFRNDRDGGYRPDDLLELARGLERVDLPEGFPSSSAGVALQERVEEGRLWIYAGSIGGFAYRFQPFELFQPTEDGDLDVFFVARRDGTVLFQRGPSGLRLANLSKLSGADGKELDLTPFANSSSQIDVRFAGEGYKLFLQPCCRGIRQVPKKAQSPAAVPEVKVTLTLDPALEAVLARQDGALGDGENAGEESWSPDWVVGGLVSTSRFTLESLRISFTVAILLVALLVLVILSAPFLRLFYVGAEEKVRVRDALAVGATVVVGVGLLTMLLLDLHAYQHLADQGDEGLSQLASHIVGNVEEELKEAAGQLNALNGLVRRSVEARLGGPPKRCEDLFDENNSKAILRPRVDLVATRLQPSFFQNSGFEFQYPGFERFAWMDPSGWQCFNWGIAKGREPRINVGERRYFRDVREDRLWSMPAVQGPDGGIFRFTLEPVVSWASGQRVVVLATSVYERQFVGALGIELSSVNRPILPAGYGFAVIDAKGDVLFHSDPARSGQENFFDEIDGARRVRAAVFARRSGPESAPYMGRGHRLYLRPMGNLLPDWTLIVFSDKRELRGFNVDLMTTAMLLLILYLLVFLIVCWLVRLFYRPYRGAWLWPDLTLGEGYSRLVFLHFFGFVAFLVAAGVLEGVHLLWFAFAFPWAILLLSYRVRTSAWIKPLSLLKVTAGLALVLLLIFVAPGSGVDLWPFDLEAALARSIFLVIVSLGLVLVLCFPSLLGPWQAAGTLVQGARSLGNRLFPEIELWPHGWRRTEKWIYLLAAALLLTVVAVMPAVSFFAVAHRAHQETRIRHKQLHLGLGIEERELRLGRGLASLGITEKLLKKRLDRKYWDVYRCNIDFDEERPQPAHKTGKGPFLLPTFLVRILPLYTDDFAKVRRLLENDDPSGDRTFVWHWPIARRVQLTLERPAKEPVRTWGIRASCLAIRVCAPASCQPLPPDGDCAPTARAHRPQDLLPRPPCS